MSFRSIALAALLILAPTAVQAFVATGKAGIVAKMGNIGITSDGGLAVMMINKTGATSVKGYLAHPDGTAGGFDTPAIDEPDILGIVFGDENGAQVADGVDCWIVVYGRAYVYVATSTSLEDFIRSEATSDPATTDGQATSEAAPSPPFSSDKHFQEVGHALEARGDPGLVLCLIHFN